MRVALLLLVLPPLLLLLLLPSPLVGRRGEDRTGQARQGKDEDEVGESRINI